MYGEPLQQQEQTQQQTEPQYAMVDLATKKKAEAEEEAEIEKMKLDIEPATNEIPGPVEDPYASRTVESPGSGPWRAEVKCCGGLGFS